MSTQNDSPNTQNHNPNTDASGPQKHNQDLGKEAPNVKEQVGLPEGNTVDSGYPEEQLHAGRLHDTGEAAPDVTR